MKKRGTSSLSYILCFLSAFLPLWLRLNVDVLGNGNKSSTALLCPLFCQSFSFCEGVFTLVHNFAANISLRDPFKPCQDSAIRFSGDWANLLGTFQSEDNLQIPLDTLPCCCLLLGTWFSGGLVSAGLMVELLKVFFNLINSMIM